jgi:hypothetical protein
MVTQEWIYIRRIVDYKAKIKEMRRAGTDPERIDEYEKGLDDYKKKYKPK